MTEVSYTYARAHLAELCDKAVDDRQPIVITRRNGESVALIAADELSAMETTVHLLSSPANARRLFEALESAERGEGQAMTIDELRREVFGSAAQSA
ncbi:MAG: type II toxin-antitoxin system prevent-host-death family antitoxin [Dehalococcoidia bacterium]|nr:type II toxin-antitoxin system prevent-host-death family antitoxin [Dehalococcoidia bacterium]